MQKRIFVAGASGAVGRVLCRLLQQDGWAVTGTTRSPEKAEALRSMGVEPIIADVFDTQGLLQAVVQAQPEVVIHQLTDLPKAYDPIEMEAARERNSHLREVGTRNLIAAAVAAKARRLIAQSIAFAYAPGPTPYAEDAPLNPTARGVIKLEEQVLNAPLEGIVLRYGYFYGPGTWYNEPQSGSTVHVEAAADAARRAVTRGKPGIYNVAEDDGSVSVRKAIEELGWSPDFRIQS